jgi:hypothetical protein
MNLNEREAKMKKILGLILVLLLFGADLYAADGDLIVNGNVGVGTTAPLSKLHVAYPYPKTDTVSRETLDVSSNDASNPFKLAISIKGASTLTNRTASIQTSDHGVGYGGNIVLQPYAGNVGIGTASPLAKLDVNGSLKGASLQVGDGTGMAFTAIYPAPSNQGAFYFYDGGFTKWTLGKETDNSFTLYDYTVGQNAIRMSGSTLSLMVGYGSGKVGIGMAGPYYQLQLSTDSAAKPGTNTWATYSDARLKTDVLPYTKGLKEILQINPVTYRYNGKGGVGQGTMLKKDPTTGQDTEVEIIDTELLSKTHVGILAQDVQAVVPEAVSSHKGKLNKGDAVETDLLDFNSHSLTFILINAVKELQAEIDLLNKQVADLKAKVK